jgi:hypothetical protein
VKRIAVSKRSARATVCRSMPSNRANIPRSATDRGAAGRSVPFHEAGHWSADNSSYRQPPPRWARSSPGVNLWPEKLRTPPHHFRQNVPTTSSGFRCAPARLHPAAKMTRRPIAMRNFFRACKQRAAGRSMTVTSRSPAIFRIIRFLRSEAGQDHASPGTASVSGWCLTFGNRDTCLY